MGGKGYNITITPNLNKHTIVDLTIVTVEASVTV